MVRDGNLGVPGPGAAKRYHGSGHPMIASFEPGEWWPCTSAPPWEVRNSRTSPPPRSRRSTAATSTRASPRSRSGTSTTLHRAVKQAFRWGLVPRNVAAAVDPPRALPPEVAPFPPAEARTLLNAARGDRLEALYVLAVSTGMRQGEILGLGWEDADLDAGTLLVRRTLALARGGPRLAEPKTRGICRQVRLTAGAVEALGRHRERQAAERAAAAGDDWSDQGLVFATRIGTPIHRANLHAESWKPLLRRAGVRDVRFHDLRHTCAILLLTKGVHPKILSEMFGHSSIAITLDIFSHVIPGLGDAAAEAMEDALRD